MNASGRNVISPNTTETITNSPKVYPPIDRVYTDAISKNNPAKEIGIAMTTPIFAQILTPGEDSSSGSGSTVGSGSVGGSVSSSIVGSGSGSGSYVDSGSVSEVSVSSTVVSSCGSGVSSTDSVDPKFSSSPQSGQYVVFVPTSIPHTLQ